MQVWINRTEWKKDTWLLFLGADSQGKEMLSRELAAVVFGSKNHFIPIGVSCFSLAKYNSMNDDHDLISNKRTRNKYSQGYIERIAKAVQENASRIFFMEDVDQVDYHSQMGIKKAIESGTIPLPCGQSIHLKDAIFILSCESFTSGSKTCSPIRQKHTKSESSTLDLNNIDAEDIGILSAVDKLFMFNI
ncbi:Clp, N-terminal [Artemisia annua]|uniref:Clp, N-terminal n=1 Tax=Artemisia annua TaxID=35608 RepID=A0A2U1P0N1_ARTAN|nr:Clp, N-terminal [Artemisia annua]